MNTRKTAEQLAAEGHWNGEVVEGAHERLFDLVDHYRQLRGITLDEAVRVVHDDLQAGRLTLSQAACVDIYRRWRAEQLGTGGVTRDVNLAEFAAWMRTGQFSFVDASSPPALPGAVIKLVTPERDQAFGVLMARLEALVQEEGLPIIKAAGRLVNEALRSDVAAPCELRLTLRAAMGRGGRHGLENGPARDLPSIETLRKWYLRHRSGAVQHAVEAAQPVRQDKKWLSREARWLKEARGIKAANAELTDLAVHAELIRRWRGWWGSPVPRDRFLDVFQRETV